MTQPFERLQSDSAQRSIADQAKAVEVVVASARPGKAAAADDKFFNDLVLSATIGKASIFVALDGELGPKNNAKDPVAAKVKPDTTDSRFLVKTNKKTAVSLMPIGTAPVAKRPLTSLHEDFKLASKRLEVVPKGCVLTDREAETLGVASEILRERALVRRLQHEGTAYTDQKSGMQRAEIDSANKGTDAAERKVLDKKRDKAPAAAPA